MLRTILTKTITSSKPRFPQAQQIRKFSTQDAFLNREASTNAENLQKVTHKQENDVQIRRQKSERKQRSDASKPNQGGLVPAIIINSLVNSTPTPTPHPSESIRTPISSPKKEEHYRDDDDKNPPSNSGGSYGGSSDSSYDSSGSSGSSDSGSSCSDFSALPPYAFSLSNFFKRVTQNGTAEEILISSLNLGN